MNNYDFCGYATKNDIVCADGRTIRRDAFKDDNGKTVPLVWQHCHDDPKNVIGHAILENRNDGVYMYGLLNDTENGIVSRQLIEHGDVNALSIYANNLTQRAGNVIHGQIREVSLVLAGANPRAVIESFEIKHSDDIMGDDDNLTGFIESGERFELYHSADANNQNDSNESDKNDSDKETKEMADNKEKTVQDVLDAMTEEQKKVVYYLVGAALEEQKKNQKGQDEEVKHNVFENNGATNNDVLSHDAMEAIFADGKKMGSLKEAVLAHADVQDASGFGSLGYTRNGDGSTTPSYGIGNVDYLFPEARTLQDRPDFIQRRQEWVPMIMNGAHHSPFSRIKSIFADITEDEARAKGYIKGNMKKNEVFGLLKRSTTPTTVYKKQKMDRDDLVDITDFDVVAWIKSEMRMQLDEEIARAALLGDGRDSSSDDKISETNIRPIWTDADLFTIKKTVDVAKNADEDTKAKAFIKAAIRARKGYKGTGNPTLFTTEDMLTSMLLLEDGIGHRLYPTMDSLATALRVKNIVTVEVMEGCTREVSIESQTHTLEVQGIIVNMADYNIGADKGGAVAMFDDFDIDYNQQKYLIETRCSGALIKPYSAIALEFDVTE